MSHLLAAIKLYPVLFHYMCLARTNAGKTRLVLILTCLSRVHGVFMFPRYAVNGGNHDSVSVENGIQ